MFMAVPDMNREFWNINLQIDIAHELGHSALIVYQAADPIFVSELDQPVLSGVRKVLRPAIMSFHAAAALAFMIEYLENALFQFQGDELRYVESELQKCKSDLSLALKALEKCEFTDLGKEIFAEFCSFV